MYRYGRKRTHGDGLKVVCVHIYHTGTILCHALGTYQRPCVYCTKYCPHSRCLVGTNVYYSLAFNGENMVLRHATCRRMNINTKIFSPPV